MTFNDKFKFLMDITNTNNTTLAGAVGNILYDIGTFVY